MWFAIYNNMIMYKDDILKTIRRLFQDRGFQVLTYTESILDLKEGTRILTSRDMAVWDVQEIVEACAEVLPVSKTKTMFILAPFVHLDRFVNRLLQFNTENPENQALKILDENGRVSRPLHKMRLDVAPARMPRDLGRFQPTDLVMHLRDVDVCDLSPLSVHIVQAMLRDLKTVSSLSEENVQINLLESKLSGANSVLRFECIEAAQIVFARFQSYHMEVGGRTVIIELQNQALQRAITGHNLLALRYADDISGDDLQKCFDYSGQSLPSILDS